jgi:hypothetical protein
VCVCLLELLVVQGEDIGIVAVEHVPLPYTAFLEILDGVGLDLDVVAHFWHLFQVLRDLLGQLHLGVGEVAREELHGAPRCLHGVFVLRGEVDLVHLLLHTRQHPP